jgi:dynein heavy chain
VKIGDKDVEYNKNFKLFLHTKLSNPHYPPEIQAETTLINFTVTEQVRYVHWVAIRLDYGSNLSA